MTLAVWNGTAADESSGDLRVLVSPSVTVTDKATGAKPSLFSDRAGNTGIGNPFTAGADGSIEFYVAPGRYKIVADDGSGNTATWDNQLIGIGGTEAVTRNVASLTDMQALSAGEYATVYMRGRTTAGDGGEGHFRWYSSNLSTEVGNDEVTTNEGDGDTYIAPASDKTGASGARVRQHLGFPARFKPLRSGNIQVFDPSVIDTEGSAKNYSLDIHRNDFSGAQTRDDIVLNLAYNMVSGQRDDASEHTFNLQLESYYFPVGGFPKAEFHLGTTDVNGNSVRPISFAWPVDQNDSGATYNLSFNLDVLDFNEINGAQRIKIDKDLIRLKTTDGSVGTTAASTIQIDQEKNDAYPVIQRNAAGTSSFGLIKLNASDEVEFGRNVSHVRIASQGGTGRAIEVLDGAGAVVIQGDGANGNSPQTKWEDPGTSHVEIRLAGGSNEIAQFGSSTGNLSIIQFGVEVQNGNIEIEMHPGEIGFFGATPVAQQSALTAANGSTVDTTYGAEERDVINNLVTRQAEIETILSNYGLTA